jgi:hypothetical protein
MALYLSQYLPYQCPYPYAPWSWTAEATKVAIGLASFGFLATCAFGGMRSDLHLAHSPGAFVGVEEEPAPASG